MVVEISARIDTLDATLEYSYAEIFRIICAEFSLDGAAIASDLGCECPFALVGFLSAE